MTYDVSRLLADPKPGMTLNEIAAELNAIAKIRNDARLSFCKRLAVAYLMIVGHAPKQGSKDAANFYKWCSEKIRSANGKRYGVRTLGNYVQIGFDKNPEALMRRKAENIHKHKELSLQLGRAMKRAITTDTPPKVIPMTKLKAQGMPTDVAREVNVLMTAWEQASSQARSQFMYIVTGKRIAA
jgi:hypothetical protein